MSFSLKYFQWEGHHVILSVYIHVKGNKICQERFPFVFVVVETYLFVRCLHTWFWNSTHKAWSYSKQAAYDNMLMNFACCGITHLLFLILDFWICLNVALWRLWDIKAFVEEIKIDRVQVSSVMLTCHSFSNIKPINNTRSLTCKRMKR